MAWYMLRAKLTQPSVQGLVNKPHDRKAAVSKLVKSLVAYCGSMNPARWVTRRK